MEWSTLLSTLLGAVIGVGSTLLADRIRWRRDARGQQRSHRHELYADYLSVLTRAHESLRLVAQTERPETTAADREMATRAAFAESGAYEWRNRISVTAPTAVHTASEETFRRLRDVRRVLAHGAKVGSADYETVREEFSVTLRLLVVAMREDVGVEPINEMR